ncbi:hypothetical protein MSTO_55890 [Mycobacterium stomatepiae]|uniref:Uncharacterized protein n=1 Tax=Mycobacterium stomatepiae TaxID=470076 RepID=A0A7I7QGA7_9MYCO|nr:hypothetical protein MSTO_55890 [Mycobacterium stomatepiae]
MPHQLPCGLRRTDNAAVSGDQIVPEAGPLGESSVRQRPNPNPQRAPHEVWNQQHFAATELSVIAYQQESAVGRQRLEAGDVGLPQVDQRRDAVVNLLQHATQELRAAWMVHHGIDIDRHVHGNLGSGWGKMTPLYQTN